MKEKSVGGIIFRKEKGKTLYLLLLYKRMNDGMQTYWDFPKGHVEEGESEEATLRREVKEETSIDEIRIIGGFRETMKYFFRRGGKTVSKEVVFYLCETEQKEAKISHEHEAIEWLEYSKAMEKLGFENAKKLLEKAHRLLAKGDL